MADLPFTLTDDEQAEFEKTLAELHANGYVDREQVGELKPGARIRHRGHQYPDALRNGTGYIVALTEKPGSAWADEWRMADIEMVVVYDRPPLGLGRLSKVAQYHVVVVHGAEVAATSAYLTNEPRTQEQTA